MFLFISCSIIGSKSKRGIETTVCSIATKREVYKVIQVTRAPEIIFLNYGSNEKLFRIKVVRF